LRRAARLGDAWHPTNIPAAEVARLGTLLDERAGRAVPRTIRLTFDAADLDTIGDRLAGYEAAGCVEAAVQLRADPGDHETHLALLPRLAKALDR
jgi:hypothetical protein